MEIGVEELRALFPEMSDEEITRRREAQVESRRQSLRDQIVNREMELEAMRAELASLEPVVTEEVQG